MQHHVHAAPKPVAHIFTHPVLPNAMVGAGVAPTLPPRHIPHIQSKAAHMNGNGNTTVTHPPNHYAIISNHMFPLQSDIQSSGFAANICQLYSYSFHCSVCSQRVKIIFTFVRRAKILQAMNSQIFPAKIPNDQQSIRSNVRLVSFYIKSNKYIVSKFCNKIMYNNN